MTIHFVPLYYFGEGRHGPCHGKCVFAERRKVGLISLGHVTSDRTVSGSWFFGDTRQWHGWLLLAGVAWRSNPALLADMTDTFLPLWHGAEGLASSARPRGGHSACHLPLSLFVGSSVSAPPPLLSLLMQSSSSQGGGTAEHTDHSLPLLILRCISFIILFGVGVGSPLAFFDFLLCLGSESVLSLGRQEHLLGGFWNSLSLFGVHRSLLSPCPTPCLHAAQPHIVVV